MENEPEIFENIGAVAKHYGKTKRTVHNWRNSGMPVLPDGRFERAAVDTWRQIKQGIIPPQGESASPSGGPSVNDQAPTSRAGKDFWDAENKQYQAKMRELDYKQRRGELIEVSLVVDEFVARVHAVKQSLISLERSLPPDLVACRSEREMSAVIHRAVYAILERFARPLPPHLQPAPEQDQPNEPG